MTDDFGSGARWTVDLWPYDAIVLFDWLMTVDFDQIPVEHKAQRQALADLLTVLETQVPVAGVTQAQIDKAQDEVSKNYGLAVPPEMTATARAGRPARWRQTRQPRGSCGDDITSISRSQAGQIAAGLAARHWPGDAARLPAGWEPMTWPPRAGVLPADDSARSGPAGRQLRVRRPGLDFGRGAADLPARQAISGGAGEGIPPDGERIGHIQGCDGQRHRHPDVVRAAPVLRSDLRCRDGRIACIRQGTFEVAADGSPGTPAVSARHGEPHRVARLPPGGRPPRHAFMIT